LQIPPPPGKLYLEKAGKTSLRLRWSEGAGDVSGVSYSVELKEQGSEGEFIQVLSPISRNLGDWWSHFEVL